MKTASVLLNLLLVAATATLLLKLRTANETKSLLLREQHRLQQDAGSARGAAASERAQRELLVAQHERHEARTKELERRRDSIYQVRLLVTFAEKEWSPPQRRCACSAARDSKAKKGSR